MGEHEEHYKYEGLRIDELRKALLEQLGVNSALTKELEEVRKHSDRLMDRIFRLRRALRTATIIAKDGIRGWRRLLTANENFLSRIRRDSDL